MSAPFLDWGGSSLDGGVWQGVEYLSVQFDVPSYAAVVTAHLSRAAAGLTADDVTVYGGESRTHLDYEVDLTNGNDFFVVRFPERGDRAPYFVGLTSGGDHPLHPFFSAAELSFYIDCPAGDCRTSSELPLREPAKPPALDYLQKDFRGFVQTLAQWVRVKNPVWADLSEASLERVLMDLLAHQADLLSYYQDRVASEAFLDTASQRYSLRQHATLLGYTPFDGRAATTTLACRVASSGFVPEGLVVRMRRTTDEASLVFSSVERVRVEPQNNWDQLTIAAWPGATAARIPAGSRELLLWGQATRLEAGQRLAFVQGTLHQIVTLTQVEAVAQPGWVAMPSDPAHAGLIALTRLCWRQPLAADLHPWQGPRLTLYANLVDAVHGEPRIAWLNPTNPPTRRDVVMRLHHRNSIVVPLQLANAMVPQLRALQVPEGPVAFDVGDGGEIVPALTVIVDQRPWQRVETLHSSRSFDTHYTADADTDGRLWLRFGDGTQGLGIEIDPATGEPLLEIELRYRTGEPLSGNCAPDTLTEIVPPLAGTTADGELQALGQVTVTNVVAGAGGQAAESHKALRQAVPASLRHGELQRAVALDDYARAAVAADPRVARAAAKALGGPFNTVLVLIDPEGQGDLPKGLPEAVHEHLDIVRMAGREHFVRAPSYVALEVALSICVCPGFLHHEVRDRVLRELRPGTRERPGYFHPDRLSFGQEIEVGDVLAFVQGLTGVRSVKVLRFRRLLNVDETPVVDRIPLGLTEVARLDADENFPDNGVLKVSVIGLDTVDTSAYLLDGPAP